MGRGGKGGLRPFARLSHVFPLVWSRLKGEVKLTLLIDESRDQSIVRLDRRIEVLGACEKFATFFFFLFDRRLWFVLRRLTEDF